MRKSIKKFLPVILIEYNPENFKKIYKELKKLSVVIFMTFFKKKLIAFNKFEIKNY